MADYEKIFPQQHNYGFPSTFNLINKFPAISKRIFDKLEDAQSFADNFNDSAIEGLLLTVINDGDNNGAYFVEKIRYNEDDEPAKLVKLIKAGDSEIENALNETKKEIEDVKKSCEESEKNIFNIIGEIESGTTISDIINKNTELINKNTELINENTELINENTESINENTELINENKNIIDEYTINQLKISENPTLNSDNLLISEQYALLDDTDNITPKDNITLAISKVETAIVNTSLITSAALNELEKEVHALQETTSGYSGTYDIYNAVTGNTELISKLRVDFDVLVSGNTENVIDNFNDIVNFLEGFGDEEKLLNKITGISENIDTLKKITSGYTEEYDILSAITDNTNLIKTNEEKSTTAITINNNCYTGVTINLGELTTGISINNTTKSGMTPAFTGITTNIKINDKNFSANDVGVVDLGVIVTGLSSEVTSTTEDVAATPKAVKTVYDLTVDNNTRIGNVEEVVSGYTGVSAIYKAVTGVSNAVETLRDDFDTLVSGNTDEVINTFNEVVTFLSGVTTEESLSGKLLDINGKIEDLQNITSGYSGESAIYSAITSNTNLINVLEEKAVTSITINNIVNTGTSLDLGIYTTGISINGDVKTGVEPAFTGLTSVIKLYDNNGELIPSSASTDGIIVLSGVTTNITFNNENYTTTNGKVDLGNGYIKSVNTIYKDLVTLRNDSQLVPGQNYRITDYVTTTKQFNTTSAGHQFDVIVTALSNNTLDENAKVCLHDGDDYFSKHNAKLEAWEIKYCLDNDDTRFGWADETNGKGVIYYMKDEWGNECPYDFKNIMFKRYKLENPSSDEEQLKEWQNAIITHINKAFGSKIQSYLWSGINENKKYWEKNEKVYSNSTSTFTEFYTFSNLEDNLENNGINDKSLGDNCYNNIIKEYILNNIYHLNNNVVISKQTNECHSNTFGNGCNSNTFGNDCSYNVFGNGCESNTFGNGCESNTFGNDCSYNALENSCRFNTFGGDCNSNIFEDSCYSNTFGNGCESNTFGNGCESNTFGNGCECNTFEGDSRFNTFEDDCNSNIFGGVVECCLFKEFCKFNKFVGESLSQCVFGISNNYICDIPNMKNITFSNNCISKNKDTYLSGLTTSNNNNLLDELNNIYNSDNNFSYSIYYTNNNDMYVISSPNIENNKFNNIKLSYSDLVTLRDNSRLVPGQNYRITDYVTTTKQFNTTSAGHQFDVIVEAVTPNTLSEIAKVCLHDGDNYFSEHNAKLEAWEIKYCLDNDVTRFAWADETETGKGVIYYMKDELGNECPYDFKNIMFILSDDSAYYTFNMVDKDNENKHEDFSVNSEDCHDNIIKPYYYYGSNKIKLNNIVFKTKNIYNYCYNNVFDMNCHDIEFEENSRYNTFGVDCYNIKFGKVILENNFKSSSDLIFGDYCSNNNIEYCAVLRFITGDTKDISSGDTDNSFYNYNIPCNHISSTISSNSGLIFIIHKESFNKKLTLKETINSIESDEYEIDGKYEKIDTSRLQNVEIKIATNSNGEIKVYCEADLID